ncbi:MAG TPA: hypothetical protein VLE97_05190 [Gaiellaceae bacterium]|nr:hypothetical protein [Gaiellaceae bacterium]
MSVKKRDRAMQRLVRERQEKTGESYQAAWQQLAEHNGPELPQARNVPHHINRLPLPFSSGKKVLPGESAQITTRPQLVSFWPDRLLVKNADRWDIHRLSVGLGKSPWSSLIEDEDRRRCASVFSLDTWQPLLRREVPLGETIVLVVTYTGTQEGGESFEAVLFGWEAEPPAKAAARGEPDPSERITERAESKSVRPDEMAVLPITIAAPALFVDRFTIADAKDWIVHDIRTHGRSIFVQGGDLPGEMFTGSAPVVLSPLAAKDRVEIAATYVGKNAAASLKVELSGTSNPSGSKRAVSYFLPMSTDVPIVPTQSAQITGAPARDFVPERLVITDADDWIVNDIKIGNRCQTAQSGDIPGQAFSIQAVGCDVTLDRVPKAVALAIIATYSESGKEEGSGFSCGVQGRLVEEL